MISEEKRMENAKKIVDFIMKSHHCDERLVKILAHNMTEDQQKKVEEFILEEERKNLIHE